VHCVITAGPTYEPLDEVRRLTNFSTGKLGTELANYLVRRDHEVTLLLGEGATYVGPRRPTHTEVFSTAADLEQRLRLTATHGAAAVFHAAAVSDFKFGRIWSGPKRDQLMEHNPGKLSTRHGTLLAELLPTPKIIPQLRDWFASATLVGWKFEVEGDRDRALALARTQMKECRTDACVINGPAYGSGYGLITLKEASLHLADQERLFEALAGLLEKT
jgi:phosphopantothenate---cysteine ligase (CTP)